MITVSAMLFLSQVLALSQNPKVSASFSGRIIDQRNQPIPGISVILDGAQEGFLPRGATTDLEGLFFIGGILPGAYTIVVSGIAFEKRTFPVYLEATDKVNRSITLNDSASQLDEVIINARSDAQELKLSAKSVQVIETVEVKLKSADLGEVLARAEGVNVQRAGGLGSNVRFSLNGLSGDQIRFFYDGIPLNFSPYAFGLANVPVNAIDRVEIYKGVVPIEFGADALGGVVNLVSPEIYEGFTGSVSYQIGSFNTHRITGNVSYSDDTTGFFVVLGSFFDYTHNNYKMDVAIPNEQGRLQQRTIRRFHDGYKAYGANFQVGIRNKRWANNFSLEGYHGDYDNEIQNSQTPGLIDEPGLGIEAAVAGSPFGEVLFTSFSQGLNLNYNVNLSAGWEFDLKAGYNYLERVSIDTSRNLHNWFGEVIRIQNQPGEFGIADHLITQSESLFARQMLSYVLSEQHVLTLSIAPTLTYRTGDDLLIGGDFDPALDDSYLFDLVTSLEYRTNLLDKRLQNIAFVKNYRQNIRIESIDPSLDHTLVDRRSVSNYGVGNGLRYVWSSQFSTKLSYEYAYRLPRQDEIFGDGQLVLENLELRPESSHNLNLQWSYNDLSNSNLDWQLNGNFFLRRIDDLIFLFVKPNNLGSFQNVWTADSKGFELAGRVEDLIRGLTLSANTTYQSYFNTSNDGPFADFEGDRIPNTPYLFANGFAEFELPDVLRKRDRLSVFWSTRYVKPFFVGWESAGLKEFKLEVPNQTIHGAGFTYVMPIKQIQNALTFEVQNLTNAKVFDLFGVQRPNRAFFIKSTIQF